MKASSSVAARAIGMDQRGALNMRIGSGGLMASRAWRSTTRSSSAGRLEHLIVGPAEHRLAPIEEVFEFVVGAGHQASVTDNAALSFATA